MDLVFLSGSFDQVGVAGRINTSTDTMYVARVEADGTIHLVRRVAGTGSDLGRYSAGIGKGSHRLKLIMSNASLSVYLDGGLVIGPITDSTISASGRAGIWLRGVANDGANLHGDNFSATNQLRP